MIEIELILKRCEIILILFVFQFNFRTYFQWVAERKTFKLLFSAGIVLAVGTSNLYISSNDNEWYHPARVTCPSHLPRQHKRPCIASSISFRFLLASSKKDQSTRERTFSLYISHSRHLNTKEHIQQGACTSFRRPFLTKYFFLLNQKDLGTSGWIPAHEIYNCFLLPATYSTRVSYCLKLLIKFLINRKNYVNKVSYCLKLLIKFLIVSSC